MQINKRRYITVSTAEQIALGFHILLLLLFNARWLIVLQLAIKTLSMR